MLDDVGSVWPGLKLKKNCTRLICFYQNKYNGYRNFRLRDNVTINIHSLNDRFTVNCLHSTILYERVLFTKE